MAYKPAQILLAVQSLRPGLIPNVDFELADMGNGPFISVWNRVDVTQPTPAELRAVDTDALLISSARSPVQRLAAIGLTPAELKTLVAGA